MLPAGTACWVLSDGKIGDEIQCLGIAEALGLDPALHHVAPRPIFALAAPYGPIDPREGPRRPHSPLAPPFPDLAIAAGRRTVPYLRALKQLSGGRTFTVFVKDPYWGRGGFDLIVAPAHDRLEGANIFSTLTPANRLSAARLAAARQAPPPSLAALPQPRVALILGGSSQHHHFSEADITAVTEIGLAVLGSGASLMVTGSRRTRPELLDALTAGFATLPKAARQNIFLWTGQEPNPYVDILGLAEQIVVTGDSVNMVGEAVATGVPVHVYEPAGGHRKITAYLDALEAQGAIRRWRGKLEDWRYPPLNATPAIAAEIARRYRAFRGFASA